MSYLWCIGMVMFFTAGALLHDVPWPRLIPAVLLILVGAIFTIIGKTQ
jgi:hypothetical protein